MIIKCKMCGGDIDFIPGATCGICEHCRNVSTIPKVEDEGRVELFNRADHFRRQGEFDKAAAAYQKILEQDDTDAEAHWGAVISRYGIIYAEDPATGKREPACRRLQLASILSDEDYKATVEYAPDNKSRRIYQREGARIAEIQKDLLAISRNEKPYDVFICYKETDENGWRTQDSLSARDVYYSLTEQGCRVFFRHAALEDKPGQEYEPYIFAALNSAKVMVVIGSRPDYLNDVWVRNEWSRYLKLMAGDRGRLLIPCCRGMDHSRLPDKLSSLQSLDMWKTGFMQDLISSIRKALDADRKADVPEDVQEDTAREAVDIVPDIDGVMGQARLFMEYGDFLSASDCLNQALDIDPEYAPAYAAKVCVSFGLRKEADLAETTFEYEDDPDWQKALCFADTGQKSVYTGYAAKVKERVMRQIRDFAYDCAMEMAVLPDADKEKLDAELAAYKASCTRSAGKRADGSRRADSRVMEEAFNQAVKSNEPGDVSEEGLKTAAAMFTAIGDSEAAERAGQCKTLAEQARQKAVYLNAEGISIRERHSPSRLEEASRLFLTIPDYKDAKKEAQACADAAESIRSRLYDSAVSAMNAAGEDSSKWDDVNKKLAKKELNGYRDVDWLLVKATRRYEECVSAEQVTKRQAEERLHRKAEAAAAKKKRNILLGILAIVVFVAAAHVVTKVIIPGKKYRNAVDLQQAGKYEEAITAFGALGDYSDSKAKISECQTAIKERVYQAAVALQQAGKYEEAITAFEGLGDYRDSETQITETRYLKAKALLQKKDYAGAAKIYIGIKGYKDVDSLLENDLNLKAAAEAHEIAVAPFRKVGGYVTFGHYEQDNETENGKEPIEWLVLEVRDGKALLISRYVLDCQPYDTFYTSSRWETCSLRKWLNGTFFEEAFSEKERTGITVTTVDNSAGLRNSGFSTSGGKDTEDRIFLLSYAEAWRYFSSDSARQCEPTKYAMAQGAYKGNNGNCWWWLRSPGSSSSSACGVSNDGKCNNYYVDSALVAVRPALWLDLTKDIF